MLAGLRGEGQGVGESTPFLLFSLQKLFLLLTLYWFASILLAEDSQPVNIWFSVAAVPHTPDEFWWTRQDPWPCLHLDGEQEGLMLVSCGTHWVRRRNRVLRQPEVTPVFCVRKETPLRVKGGAINDRVGTQM